MTDKQKEFIWLAFAEKMKYPEIAKQLNVSRFAGVFRLACSVKRGKLYGID
jgi:predicted DNA-binding protein YlxM (UPF0122 family)